MKPNQQVIDLLTRRAEKAEAEIAELRKTIEKLECALQRKIDYIQNAEAKLEQAADYASALSDDLDRKKAEIVNFREAVGNYARLVSECMEPMSAGKRVAHILRNEVNQAWGKLQEMIGGGDG